MSLASLIASTAFRDKDPALSKMESVVDRYFASYVDDGLMHNHLRASQMYDLCPRQFVLDYWSPKGNIPFDRVSRMRMTVGTHLHWYWQNFVFGPLGLLYGKWASEHEVVQGFHPDPHRALFEAAKELPPTWEFQEFTVREEKYRIAGHVDGLICLERLKFFRESQLEIPQLLEEIQSVDSKNFAILEMKFASSFGYENYLNAGKLPEYYRSQANIYQGILGIHRTLIVYCDRDQMRMDFSWYTHEGHWWADAKNLAELVWTAIRDKTLPEARRKCEKPTESRAKKCAQCTTCFSEIDKQFSAYVEDCIKRQPLRDWLDLSDLVF